MGGSDGAGATNILRATRAVHARAGGRDNNTNTHTHTHLRPAADVFCVAAVATEPL